MTLLLPLRSVAARLLLGGTALLVFGLFAYQIENDVFAEYLARIPLFGTELATVAQPRDPKYEFQLGEYWLVANRPELAVPHLQRATELDPRNGRFWGQLASAYQQVGNLELARKAIDRCLIADPTTPELLWAAANLNIFLGDRDKAIVAIHRFVASSPEQLPMASQLAWRATRDAKLILEHVLPRGTNSDLALLIALIRIVDPQASARIRTFDNDPNNSFVHNLALLGAPDEEIREKNVAPKFDLEAAKEKARAEMNSLIERRTGRDLAKTQREVEAEHNRQVDLAYAARQTAKQKHVAENADVYTNLTVVWQNLMRESRTFDLHLCFPYLQMLIDSNQERAAAAAWEMVSARRKRLPGSSVAGNLINNSGFEYEILNGGLDWQYTPSENYALGIDHTNAKDGSASLLVRFENKRVADAGIVQYVPIQPDTEYTFSGYMKTDFIQTASGPRFFVQDTDAEAPYFEGKDLRGTVNWTLVEGRFRTRPTAHFVSIRIMRDPAASLIKGNLWIDTLSLSPVESSAVQGN